MYTLRLLVYQVMAYQATIKVVGENLKNTDAFGLSDPYFTLSFKGEQFYKSEVIENEIERLEWQPARIEIPCGAVNQLVKLEV